MDFGTVTRNVQWFEEMKLVLVIQSEGFLLRKMGIQGMPSLKINLLFKKIHRNKNEILEISYLV